jgi:dihydrofolate reductase
MATLVADMTMSVDGFIALPDDEVGPLFDWYSTGPVETPSASENWTYRTDEKSAEMLRGAADTIGALICGRRLFEHAKAWGGKHPVGCPVIVVSHSIPEGWPRPEVPFHFVDGVEKAVALAREIAGDRVVAVATPTITQQCLNLGLLDVIRVNLAPVLLGSGIPFFANLRDTPIRLEDPEVETGHRVTHLTYRLRRPGA